MNALAKQDSPQAGATILDIVARAASDPSVDMDKLERLYAMRERELSRVAL